jgi:hypothetical protein
MMVRFAEYSSPENSSPENSSPDDSSPVNYSSEDSSLEFFFPKAEFFLPDNSLLGYFFP